MNITGGRTDQTTGAVVGNGVRYLAGITAGGRTQLTGRTWGAHHRQMVEPVGQNADDLVARLATTPGLVRAGISRWDMNTRLPLHPLAVENAYGDPALLHAWQSRAWRSPTGWQWMSSS